METPILDETAEDMLSILEKQGSRGGQEQMSEDVEKLEVILGEVREATRDLERAGRALALGNRQGKVGLKRQAGGVETSRVLLGVLLTVHTVLVASVTAIAVVGLLTGRPWRELILRLVQ